MSVSHYFPAAPNTISVMFNSALGNGNFLNLDHMIVTDLRITDLVLSPPGNVRLTWDAVSGLTYRVQYMSSLTGGFWSNLGSSITATGSTASATDTIGNNARRYYRVVKP